MSRGKKSKLFQPLKVGSCQLSNRVIMAPLTRFRADDAHVPTPMMATYYAQRACVPGTLLVTEATFISPKAAGYPNVPGIYSPEQINAWKTVTDAVHEKGSFIYLQLWHLGRAAGPENLALEGERVVSSSATPMPGKKGLDGKEIVPHELSEEEIWQTIGDYAQAAKNAIEAGFDGVEIHGANGYLIDQFTQDVCNKRQDAWGGSIENRSRFAVEVTKAVVEAVGADKTGIRLSPFSTFQGMLMKDPIPQFSYIINKIKSHKLAYLHVVESRISGSADQEATEKVDFAIDLWSGVSPIFIAGGFTPESAVRAVDEEYTDKEIGIVFGRYFISNPDLVFRIKEEVDLVPYDRSTFYIPKDTKGYLDYPFSKEFDAARL